MIITFRASELSCRDWTRWRCMRKWTRLGFVVIVICLLTMSMVISIDRRDLVGPSIVELLSGSQSNPGVMFANVENMSFIVSDQTMMKIKNNLCEDNVPTACHIEIIPPACLDTGRDILFYCKRSLGKILKVIRTSPKSNSTTGRLLINGKMVTSWQHPMKPYVLFGAVEISTCKFLRYGMFHDSGEKRIHMDTVAEYQKNISENFWTVWIGESPIIATVKVFFDMPDSKLLPHYKAGFAAVMSPHYVGAMEYAFSGSKVEAYVEKTIHKETPFKFNITRNKTQTEIFKNHPDISPGGSWSPTECQELRRLAIIVPFRKRWTHLFIFLDAIFTFLKRQRSAFDVYIIHQAEPELFNRASLMNIGYLESRKNGPYDCYIFHDVDLIPNDLSNIYKCDDQPRHLAVARSKDRYRESFGRYWDYQYFGGAIAMKSDQIRKINGFSNKIFGWGGEDDEIAKRINSVGMNITEYPVEISTYTELQHKPDGGNPHMNDSLKFFQLYAEFMMFKDGLNTTKYNLLSTKKLSFYTEIYVKIEGPSTPKEQKLYTEELRRQLFKKKAQNYQQIVKEIKTTMRP